MICSSGTAWTTADAAESAFREELTSWPLIFSGSEQTGSHVALGGVGQ
jgi:hypothetical protein